MATPTLVSGATTSAQQGSASSTIAVNLGWSPAVGDMLFCVTVSNGTGIPSTTASDNKSNVWANDLNAAEGGGSDNSRIQIWRTPITVGGSSFTVNIARSAACVASYCIFEFQNVQTSPSPLDNSNSAASTTAAAPTSGAVTQAAANDLFIFACTDEGSGNNSITEGTAGATNLCSLTNTTNQPLDVFYLVASATKTGSWTLSPTADNIAVGASYKASTGAADPGGLPNFGAPQIYRPIFSEWLGRTLFSKRSTAPAGIVMPRVWRPSLAVPSAKRLICAGASNGLRSLQLGSRRTAGIADSFAGTGAR